MSGSEENNLADKDAATQGGGTGPAGAEGLPSSSTRFGFLRAFAPKSFRVWWLAGLLVCLAILVFLFIKKREAVRIDAEPVWAHPNILREIGSVESSKEEMVLTRFNGEIIWKIEEGTFVDAGTPIVKFGTKPPATTIEEDIATREKDRMDKKDAVRIAQAALLLLRRRNCYLIKQQRMQFLLAARDRKLLYDAPRSEERRHMELVLKAAEFEKDSCEWETKGYADLAQRGLVPDAKLKEQQYILAGKVANYMQAKSLYDLTIQGTPADVKRVADLALADAEKKYTATQFNCAADLKSAKATLALAKIDLANCERDLRIKYRDYAQATVRAPLRGRVAFVDVYKGSDKGMSPIQVGEKRVAGQDLCKICDTSAFRIVVWINEADISRVRVGQRATVKMAAFPGKTFTAVVEELGVVAVDKNVALSQLALKSAGEAFVNVVEAKLDFTGLADEDRQAMRINYTAEVDIEADPRSIKKSRQLVEGSR